MKKLIVTIQLLTICWIVLAQNDSTLIKVEQLPFKVEIDTLTKVDPIVAESLQGKLIDPVILNEIGLCLIASNKSPNIGIGVDFQPLFLRKIKTEIQFRSDFKENTTFKVALETKYLTRNIDLKLNYEKYSIAIPTLRDYDKICLGPTYRTNSTSIGILVGRDTFEKQIGLDILLNHRFILDKTSFAVNSKKKIIITDGFIGLWDSNINYLLKMTYLINYRFSCGIEYHKLYDFDELLLTLRYGLYY